MDLRGGKKNNFDAFKGFSLSKQHLNTRSKTSVSRAALSGSQLHHLGQTSQYEFDSMWRGSISNLMSCENITESLVKETVQELENAMNESKRMLVERDTEIERLREVIENNRSTEDDTPPVVDPHLLQQLEDSHKQIVELEKQISNLKAEQSRHIQEKRKNDRHYSALNSGKVECTCYCGSVCKALVDLTELERNHEAIKIKYDTLKKKVREFRKHAEQQQQHENVLRDNYEGEKTNCSIQ